jgi:hypothetical protein
MKKAEKLKLKLAKLERDLKDPLKVARHLAQLLGPTTPYQT